MIEVKFICEDVELVSFKTASLPGTGETWTITDYHGLTGKYVIEKVDRHARPGHVHAEAYVSRIG